MSKHTIADAKTRLVKAVSRRPAVSEVETREVKAVRRKRLGLLPEALLETKHIWFTELRSINLSGNDYVFGCSPRASLMRAESRLHVFKGWRYDFTEGGGVARFSMRRKSKLLMLAGLEVFDAAQNLIGAFHQRATGFSVHFDVVDGRGAPRFTVQQPADVSTAFFVRRGPHQLAVLSRGSREWDGSLTDLVRVADAFTIEFQAANDELDRTLIIAAGLLLDRLFFNQEEPAVIG